MQNTIKLRGTRVTRKSVDIEVSRQYLLDKVVELVHKAHPMFAKGYVDELGYWMLFSFTDGHNGDDNYKRDRPATQEELIIQEHIKFISNL